MTLRPVKLPPKSQDLGFPPRKKKKKKGRKRGSVAETSQPLSRSSSILEHAVVNIPAISATTPFSADPDIKRKRKGKEGGKKKKDRQRSPPSSLRSAAGAISREREGKRKKEKKGHALRFFFSMFMLQLGNAELGRMAGDKKKEKKGAENPRPASLRAPPRRCADEQAGGAKERGRKGERKEKKKILAAGGRLRAYHPRSLISSIVAHMVGKGREGRRRKKKRGRYSLPDHLLHSFFFRR